MLALIYLILTKFVSTIVCAPVETAYNNQNSDTTKPYNEIQTYSEIKSTIILKPNSDLTEKNGVVNTEKDPKVITKSDFTEKNTVINTEKVPLKKLEIKNWSNKINETIAKIYENVSSQENAIIDSDESDWLDPDFEGSKNPKRRNETATEKNESNTYSNVSQVINNTTRKPIEEKTLKDDPEIGPLYEDIIRSDDTSKREILEPNTIIMKILRSVSDRMNPQDLEEQHENGDGYDYNVNICRYVGDRYLCGYNKNKGEIRDPVEIEQLSDDCRIRGNRMECGYHTGPWPIVKNHPNVHLNEIQNVDTKNPTTSHIQQLLDVQITNTDQATQVTYSTTSSREITKPPVSAKNALPRKRRKNARRACYEQDDRVVCYNVPV